MSYPFNFGFLYGAENDGNVPPLAVPTSFSKTNTPETTFNTQIFNTVGNTFNNISSNSFVQSIGNNYPAATLNDIVSYYKNNPNKKVDVADVVNDFTWTISPKSSRQDVPYIWLNERYITLNALLNQAVYGISATLDNKAAQFAIKSLQTTAQSIETNFTSLSSMGLYNSLKTFFSDLGQDSAAAANKLLDKFGIVDTLGPVLESPLTPYKGLYYTVESGFNYRLPLFTSEFWSTTNDFTDNAGEGNSEFVAGLVESVKNLGLEASKLINTGSNQYGTYVEFPKQYTMSSPSTYTVQFDLINTKPATYTDVKSNFKLLLLLFYQNLPIRRSKQLVDPPVIYNIYVPGQKRMPYACLSSIAIKNLGATRMMDMDFTDIRIINPPSTATSTFPKIWRTPIPDAYRITLTFKDLIPETKNTVYSSFLSNSIIETSVAPRGTIPTTII